MITVSDKFRNAAYSDSSAIAYQVLMYLGNYASAGTGATVLSSGDASANYPAAGAIDGDRTELNVGAASGADNDVGKSSWRSSGIPDNGDTVTLDITFAQERTINRVKLYHLSSHGLKKYKLYYWDGAAWVLFAATDNAGGTIASTHELDVIDFSDVTTTKVRLEVLATQVAVDAANVVELEVYRAVDISSRVRAVGTTRGRDYKLQDPIASQVSITGINTDRFFSKDYVPTAAEVAAGFVNSELRPGLGLVVKAGFDIFVGDPELVTIFTGTIDSIKCKSSSVQADISGTDGMKQLLRTKDSSKLKTSIDIRNAIEYILNRANISSYECELDTTSVTLDYFFTNDEDHLSTIRELVAASSDALFFFNSSGVAVFQFFDSAVGHDQIFTSQVDWETGTLLDIDTTSISGKILYKYADTAAALHNSTSGWTSDGSTWSGSSSFTHDGSGLLLSATSSATGSPASQRRTAAHSETDTVGAWDIHFQENLAGLGFAGSVFYIMATNYVSSEINDFGGTHIFKNGYAIQIFNSAISNWATCKVTLYRLNASGARTSLGVTGVIARNVGTPRILNIRRSAAGNMNIFLDNVLLFSVTDATHTVSTYFGYEFNHSAAVVQTNSLRLFQNGLGLPSNTTGIATWTSPTVDMTADVNALGILDFTHVLNSGTVLYETRTSVDGSVWDAWTAIDAVTKQILSTLHRYIQVRITLTFSVDTSPEVSDITINWTQLAGSAKYPAAPASHTFHFEGTLRDLEIQLTDKMAGITAILNDVSVQAQPIVLDGNNTDVKWQSLNGTPQEPVSGSNPLNVTNGDVLTFPVVVSGGMDTALMAGANPAAGVVTFAGGAAGTWRFSSIHPTRPVLEITISASGTITDLKIQGKAFSNATFLQVSRAQDADSIRENGRCQESISNKWVGSKNHALVMAEKLVDNFKDPVSYIPGFRLDPLYNAEEGDRVTVTDTDGLGLSADFVIANLQHRIDVSESGDASLETSGALLRVPAGL